MRIYTHEHLWLAESEKGALTRPGWFSRSVGSAAATVDLAAWIWVVPEEGEARSSDVEGGRACEVVASRGSRWFCGGKEREDRGEGGRHALCVAVEQA